MPAPQNRRRMDSSSGRSKPSRSQNGRGLRGRRQRRAPANRRGTERMAPQSGGRWNRRTLNRGGGENLRRPSLSRRDADTMPGPPISERDRRRGSPQKRMGTEATPSRAKVRRIEKLPIILQDETGEDTSFPSVPQDEGNGDPSSTAPPSPAPVDEAK